MSTATATPMIAFHGDEAIKTKYLDRIAEHRRLDNLVRGETGRAGKGCSVWCTLNKYEHAAYETELGIPRAIARLEDGLFESLPVELAMEWPQRFLAAIRPGADLSMVLPRFFLWLLVDPTDGVLQFAKSDKSKIAISAVAALYVRRIAGDEPKLNEWKTAAEAAAWVAVAAAWVAVAAAEAAVAAGISRSMTRAKQADKLIELLEAA